MYQKDGRLARLVVPVLTIVPIPLIVIDEVDIKFKANIHASASQATRNHESQDLSGSLDVTAKAGWGPFSLSATLKASYSSKKDSTATQKSQYSVEYTQDVRVHASQAGMPAGLATVLNILSNSATEGSKEGTVTVSPRVGLIDVSDPNAKQSLTVTVVDANGLRCERAKVTFAFPQWLAHGTAPLGTKTGRDEGGKYAFETDEDGTVSLLLWVKNEKPGESDEQGEESGGTDKPSDTGDPRKTKQSGEQNQPQDTEIEIEAELPGGIKKKAVFYLMAVNRTGNATSSGTGAGGTGTGGASNNPSNSGQSDNQS